MTDNMKKFLELISDSEELSAKLNIATMEEAIAIAKEQGITLTDADFVLPSGEVSDDELDGVSGGISNRGQQSCLCVTAGVGYTKQRGINRF